MPATDPASRGRRNARRADFLPARPYKPSNHAFLPLVYEKDRHRKKDRNGPTPDSPHHRRRDGPLSGLRTAAAGPAVHHARRRGRKLVLSAGCALPDRRRTDGAVPLRRLEEQALLRRSTRPRGVGSAPDGRRRSAAGQRRTDRRRDPLDDRQPQILRLRTFLRRQGAGVESGRATGERRGARTGHPRGFDVPQRPTDGVGQRDRHSLRIPLRAVAGTHRRRRHRSQQRPVGARRNSRQPRIGRDLRDPQPRRAVPLRRVAQQALLRRHGTPRSGSTTGSKGLPKAKPSPKKSTDRRRNVRRPGPTIHPCRNIPAGAIFIRGIMRFHVADRRFVSADLPSAARAERNSQNLIPFSRPDKGNEPSFRTK